jgi:ubiquinone/menaquinone biosynthesis C-methylase UbiE
MEEGTPSTHSENRPNQHEKRYLLEKILPEHSFRGRLLEIGAGSCWASALIKRESPSTTVIASDISIGDLRTGMKTTHESGSKADFFVGCNVEELPFKDNLFDFVFGNAIIHHLSNVEKGISEIRRVLKTGGKYVGSGEPMGSVFFKKIWRNRFLAKAIRRNTSEETFFTLKDLQTHFNVSGFGKLGIRQKTSWQYKDPDYHLAYAYYKAISRFPDFIINSFLVTGVDVVATKN